MNKRWSNWSGSLKFTPTRIESPESEEELASTIKKASKNNQNIRIVGAGHSSSPLVVTKGCLVSLKHFTGIENPSSGKLEATVLGGTTVHDAGKELHENGLAMHNTGDVDVQVLAGAISTGTHGTGTQLQNLSSMLKGGRLITAAGEILEFTEEQPELLRALKVSLGTMGIFTKIKIKALATFNLHRTEWCTHVEDCLAQLNDLAINNRNFDFYWYPRSDLCKIRIMNEPGKGTNEVGFGQLEMKKTGPGYEILPRSRPLKFDEMEYAIPVESGPECFQEVREYVKQRFRKEVAWRVLYRTVKADDAMLSPAYKRDTVTISLHQNAGLPFWEYFKAIEPIFRGYKGRPHWGKKHTLKQRDLQELYPEWDKFQKLRQEMDPKGVFLSGYLKNIFLNKQLQ